MDMDGPAVKRQKLTNGAPKRQHTPGTSRLFAPYRTLGLVSPTAVPFTSVALGKTTFQITTSVGRALQTYDLRRGLNLVFITRPQTPGPITASAAWKDKVFGAWAESGADGQRGVWVFKRGKKEAELEVPQGWKQDVQAFCCFGGWVVGVCATALLVWKSGAHELYTTLEGPSPVPFTPCITSLPTYLNKLLVARRDGSAEIWNVSSGKLVFTVLPPSTAYGAITALEPTPALSLVAIAYAHGPLLIHDIRTDETLLALQPPPDAPITSITFRTDSLGAGSDGQTPGVMATASLASGDVTLWDLSNAGRRTGVLRAAHAAPTPTTPGGITRVHFLPGQSILASSGLDNSLHTWIFDLTPFSPLPRPLHHRSGHGAPITRLEFLPASSSDASDAGKWLLSASRDRTLWAWSLRRDAQSTELSQGALASKAKTQGLLPTTGPDTRDSAQLLKCPPVTHIASSLNRDGGIGALPGQQPIWQTPGRKNANKSAGKNKNVADAEVAAMTGWESVLTAHANDSRARTWFWGRKRAGRWALPTSDASPVSSVAISPCGTFALVGSELGGVDMFNLQSGVLRQRFPARLTPGQAKAVKLDMSKSAAGGEGERSGKADDVGGKIIFFRGQGKHASPVVGLAVDSLNKTVLSAGRDGEVKFWDFGTGMLVQGLDLSATAGGVGGGGKGITAMRLHRDSELAAFACGDACVRVVDMGTRRLVRELWLARPNTPTPLPQSLLNLLTHHRQTFADLALSPSATHLAAALGPLILVWDVPTGHLVDAFVLAAACTSLAFSPTGEFLATGMEGSVGVEVWSNRALFKYVGGRRIGVEELGGIVGAGVGQGSGVDGGVEGGLESLINAPLNTSDDELSDDGYDADEQEGGLGELSADLLSLSLLPRSRWQNLLHADLIRQRNKPALPPTKPAKAPFFLPSLRAGRVAGDTNAGPSSGPDVAELERERTRVLGSAGGGNGRGEFSALLLDAGRSKLGSDYAVMLEYLKALSPAAADIAIRSLSPVVTLSNDNGDGDNANSSGEMPTFILALTWLLHERRDFELGMAWMGVFLRVHGDVVAGSASEGGVLAAAVAQWRRGMEGERARVGGLVGYVGGVVGFLRAARV
ncbi:hypothetical protein LTR08_009320 [Meristemomyces frigidus]|nr:hypothetical protein LTR08_009320 [Meristemomyces frigidus]